MKQKYVVWYDETSINYWSNVKSKTWTDDSVVMPYQTKRGTNCTIYGCIGGFQHKQGAAVKFFSSFMVANKTNSRNTVEFFRQVISEAPVRPGQIVFVGDNHSAHLSNVVRAFCISQGISQFQLPPLSSPLNPQEHVWSRLKALWSKVLAGQTAECDS